MFGQSSWINDLSSIFQIFETVAVVASLIFIAFELRHTRRFSASSSYQALLESVNSFYASLITSEDLAYIYWQGRKDPMSLSNKQRPRFFYLCVQWFCFYENLYLQYAQGFLLRSHFDAWTAAFREDLREPGIAWYWQLEKQDFSEDFQDYVDQIIDALDAKGKIVLFDKILDEFEYKHQNLKRPHARFGLRLFRWAKKLTRGDEELNASVN